MEYRSPTRQPAREAAVHEKQLDDHIERSQRERAAERERVRRRARLARLVPRALLLSSIVVGAVGHWLDSRPTTLAALAFLIAALFGVIYRLLAKIPPRDGGGLGGSSGLH